jgi:hypothetical protein
MQKDSNLILNKKSIENNVIEKVKESIPLAVPVIVEKLKYK